MQALAVTAGRLAEVLGAVAAEVTQRGEIHAVSYLRERQAVVIQKIFQYGDGVAVDVGGDAMASNPLDGGSEVFGGYVQSLGVVADIALGAANAGGKKRHQLLHDIGCALGMRVGGLALCMGLKDIIHHGQAQSYIMVRHRLPIN